MNLESRSQQDFKDKVYRLRLGTASDTAVSLLVAGSSGDAAEFERCLTWLASTKGHHGARLTPLTEIAASHLDPATQPELARILTAWRNNHLDTFDGLNGSLTRKALHGNYLVLMSMPGMPQSSKDFHHVTVWFEDGTSIRHGRVYNRTELEVPAGWENKRIANMAFLLDQP